MPRCYSIHGPAPQDLSRDAREPRDDTRLPPTGVFATRSPDRPNPIGLHRVRLLALEGDGVLLVRGLEAIHGTPVLDIKPALEEAGGW